MGFGRMLLLGNLGQQLDIGDLSTEIQRMESAFARNRDLDREQAKAISALEQERHELKLYLATLLRLLVSKGVLNANEVETAVHAIEKER